jgi:hypothetical protein
MPGLANRPARRAGAIGQAARHGAFRRPNSCRPRRNGDPGPGFGKRLLMSYNGNGFGNCGFGVAEAVIAGGASGWVRAGDGRRVGSSSSS